MKIENQIETILLSIQMECCTALSHVRKGEFKQARKVIDSIDMQCWHAFNYIDDHTDSVMEAQERAHANTDKDIPW